MWWRQVVPLSPTTSVTDAELSRTYREAGIRLDRLAQGGLSWSGHERNCAYLNTRSQRFANISAVSGFGFSDDGRAIALTDWDHDGDLDVWTMNRTGPRVRFLRNDVSATTRFLGLRLQGTSVNRDAIGARVVLVTKKGNERRSQMRSVRAGEGFLGQSSKTVHFGLGHDEEIDEVTIMWPGGQSQVYEDIWPNHYYLAIESEPQLRVWTAPPGVNKRASLATTRSVEEQITSHATKADVDASVLKLLAAPVPLPSMSYKTFDGKLVSIAAHRGRPLLINLWASWCAPCIDELVQFADGWPRLGPAGPQVVALSTDQFSIDTQTESDDAPRDGKVPQLVEELNLPFAVGFATETLVEKVQIIDQYLFRPHRPLPLPCSLLIDADGQLAAVYRGPVSVDRVLADLSRLSMSTDERITASLPFPGRWIRRPSTRPRLLTLATSLIEYDFIDDALKYIRANQGEIAADPGYASLLHRLGAVRLARGQKDAALALFRESLEVAPDDADGHFNLGVAMAETGDSQAAVRHYKQAIRLNPTHVRAINNLGLGYQKKGRVEDAERLYKRALQLSPNLAEVHYNLANLYRSLGNLQSAERHYAIVTSLDSAHPRAHYDLGLLCASRRDSQAAANFFRKAIDVDPQFAAAHFHLANTLASLRELSAAISHYRQAIVIQPTFPEAHGNLGRALMQMGDERGAIASFRTSIHQQSEQPLVAAALAWLLATSPHPELRDSAESVRLARTACRGISDENPQLLDVLAAALAANGEFQQAVRVGRESSRILEAAGKKDQAQQILRRVKLFESGEAYFRTQRK